MRSADHVLLGTARSNPAVHTARRAHVGLRPDARLRDGRLCSNHDVECSPQVEGVNGQITIKEPDVLGVAKLIRREILEPVQRLVANHTIGVRGTRWHLLCTRGVAIVCAGGGAVPSVTTQLAG